MEYFIIDNNGQQAGPFSQDQLVQKAISPETLVWKQGMADWTPAWKVEELRTVLEAVEANKPNSTNQQENQEPQQQTSELAQQQAYQQAQQQAYQQGFQQGATMNANFQQQPKKRKSHMAIKLIIGLIVFIIAVFAVSNPGADAHKEKVRTEVGKAIEKATSTSDNNFFTQALRSVAKMMAGSVMDEAMNQLFEYHNYIVCSKGTVEFNGKQHTVSFGILGTVYTMNADDMVKALEGADNLQLEEMNSSSSDDTSSIDEATSSSDDTSADEGFGAKVQKRLEDKANQAMDKAADKVGKKIEEKINQKLDEATDSSKVEKLIDKILEFL
uniref:GYF domain-containing protein n=1 Tax=Prevotella sp. TaxID=59823 RepID=UPI003FEDE41F